MSQHSFSLGRALSACCIGLVATTASADLMPYSQDFESLDKNSGTALQDGWVVGANVFEPDGTTFIYNYFAFPAPNGSGGFSNVTDTSGGALDGNQGLVVFSDYNNGDHNNGRRIEAIFFREMTIGAADVGSFWEFSFLAGPGDLSGETTAQGFIKTIDNSGNATNFLVEDTTSLAGPTNLSIVIEIIPELVGQKLQIGFDNTASNFDGSGVNYDNINFAQTVPEPTSLALIGMGAAFMLRRRR